MWYQNKKNYKTMKQHTFHIPVMGIGYTIDTPIKVAHYGIDSVISLVDDILLEKLRKYYSEKNNLFYTEISEKSSDFRARRITAYLNMVQDLVEKKFEAIKNVNSVNCVKFKSYFNNLPDLSPVKQQLTKFIAEKTNIQEIQQWIKNNVSFGSIDVNIMTKVDKTNFNKNTPLPVEFNDAHAAFRGFARSRLSSSIVLSAGMNPRLYAYMEQFSDFYPDATGNIKKKIILKVSDYRSALIQGKFLAKKGLWVSEYRIESGLNCGGHAFATDGFLMGPVLKEFKENRTSLQSEIQKMVFDVLEKKGMEIPTQNLTLKITAQGGVGTAEEHEFLMNEYELDSVGWGSPFLLVPEATTVDEETLSKLLDAKEEDIYLSNISPLGIPFNNLKGNTKDAEKLAAIKDGKPGAACTKKFVTLNYDYTDKGLCIASRKYQANKIKELKKQHLSPADFQKEYDKITEKSCICVGLGTPALLEYGIEHKTEGPGVSVCPGPNLAYFNKSVSLESMLNHIYGKENILEDIQRPHVFVKELKIYIDYLQNQIKETAQQITTKHKIQFGRFVDNLKEGVLYYQSILKKPSIQIELARYNCELNYIKTSLDKL